MSISNKDLSINYPDTKLITLFQKELLHWYYINGRKYPWRSPSATNYIRIVCEVLLKRTRAETVASFAPDFFRKYPSWKKLSSASEQQLQADLRPIGLWRQRSTPLLNLAKVMASKYGRFPKERIEIESLPGVGQYTANAILLFYFHRPEPLLDTNMSRVLERYFGPRLLSDIRYDPYLQNLSKIVVNCDDPISINWAILDFAALVCTPTNLQCADCPITYSCKHFIAIQMSC
ncbi:hypothetical protein ACFLYN_05525 [Chloroflexota bacterium]